MVSPEGLPVILVTGGEGQLGHAFRGVLGDRAVYPTEAELDLSDADALTAALASIRPEVIINCAAYTAVDAAEEHEDAAHAVNADAVGQLAQYAAQTGARLLTFSTDYVFDGTSRNPYTESDPTAPLNAYGRSKLAGEQAALAACPSALVIRTSWLLSGGHPNFVQTMLQLARTRQLRVVSDQYGCPTVAAGLAESSWKAFEAGLSGLLHLAGPDPTTWYELAQEVLSLAGIDADRVVPCTTEDYPTPATRPIYSVLATERTDLPGDLVLPSWKEALPDLVAEQLMGLS